MLRHGELAANLVIELFVHRKINFQPLAQVVKGVCVIAVRLFEQQLLNLVLVALDRRRLVHARLKGHPVATAFVAKLFLGAALGRSAKQTGVHENSIDSL